MPLTYTGSEGLFTRLGRIIHTANLLDTFRGSTALTRTAAIEADFTTTDRGVVEGVYADLNQFRNSSSDWTVALGNRMSQALIAQVEREVGPLPVGVTDSTTAALQVLAREMTTDAASIAAPTVTATTALSGSNAGDCRIVASARDARGFALDYAHAETVQVQCSALTLAGGNESWTVTGFGSVSPTDWNWPQGSGTALTLTTLEPTTIPSPRLTDGGFDSWTSATVLANWTPVVGVGGTNFSRETATLKGTYALRLLTATATATVLEQVVILEPLTTYVAGFWAKKSANDASGVVRISLVDATGTLTTDEAGNSNAITAALASGGPLSTSTWTFVGGTFRTPRRTNGLKVRIGWSTVPANGVHVDVDQALVEPATVLYPGGPAIGIVCGGTSPGLGDSGTVTVANSGTVTGFARSLDRFLQLKERGVRIPSSGSPTIANSLIA